MQINPVRFSQNNNKPAFAGKAFIHTMSRKNTAKLSEEAIGIIDTFCKEQKSTEAYKLTYADNGFAIFAPDAHIAEAISGLAKKGWLSSDVNKSINILLESGEKAAHFFEKGHRLIKEKIILSK